MSIRGVKPGNQRKDIFEENIIWDIIPQKTAFLIIDMQNCFVDPKGFSYIQAAKGIVPNINKAANICREKGILIIWIKWIMKPNGLNIGYIREFHPGHIGNETSGLEGAWGAELYPELDVKESDMIVAKNRNSAFVPGSSDLDRLLRYMSKDTIIVSGIATNVCCGVTVMDASNLDYKVIYISDASAAVEVMTQPSDNVKGLSGQFSTQEVWLRTFRGWFAMVCTTDELIEQMNTTTKNTHNRCAE